MERSGMREKRSRRSRSCHRAALRTGPLVRLSGTIVRMLFNHRATGSFSVIALRRIRDSDSTEYGF